METCAASLGFLRFLHSRLRRVRRTCAAPGFLHRREPPPPSSAHRRLPVAVAAVAPSSLAPRGRAVVPQLPRTPTSAPSRPSSLGPPRPRRLPQLPQTPRPRRLPRNSRRESQPSSQLPVAQLPAPSDTAAQLPRLPVAPNMRGVSGKEDKAGM
jgi:hypothetical protein